MSKHTPGPWANTNDIEEEGFADIESVNGLLYIRASWGSMRRLAKGEKKQLCEQMKADARLIAAAPELLEALQMVRDSTAVLNHLDSDAQQFICGVIAKATLPD